MRCYVVSWLAQQYREHDLEAFVRERPESWVVWEAGPWRPPAAARATLVASEPRAALAAGESLAIALPPVRDGSEVKLGRAPENDLVIDDATLSRAHLGFTRDAAGGWSVRDLGSSNGSRVAGARLGPDPVALEPGTAIDAGNVRLTYCDPPTLFLRLRGVR